MDINAFNNLCVQMLGHPDRKQCRDVYGLSSGYSNEIRSYIEYHPGSYQSTDTMQIYKVEHTAMFAVLACGIQGNFSYSQFQTLAKNLIWKYIIGIRQNRIEEVQIIKMFANSIFQAVNHPGSILTADFNFQKAIIEAGRNVIIGLNENFKTNFENYLPIFIDTDRIVFMTSTPLTDVSKIVYEDNPYQLKRSLATIDSVTVDAVKKFKLNDVQYIVE